MALLKLILVASMVPRARCTELGSRERSFAAVHPVRNWYTVVGGLVERQAPFGCAWLRCGLLALWDGTSPPWFIDHISECDTLNALAFVPSSP
jgi:hypothetical protein